jgi:hypothetical protein
MRRWGYGCGSAISTAGGDPGFATARYGRVLGCEHGRYLPSHRTPSDALPKRISQRRHKSPELRREWPRSELCSGSKPISPTQFAMGGQSYWPRPRSWLNRLNSIIEQSAEQSPPMDDLPPPNTTRWTIRRKAAVVVAVRSGTITMEEALRRYQVTEEEFLSWQRAFETHGLAGLRVTRVQQYRRSRPPRGPRSQR